MSYFVTAVIATYKRPRELARLLASLKEAGPSFGAVVITDNANEEAVWDVFQASGLQGSYQPQRENRGCGGGLAAAEAAALAEFPQSTHLWILDDDVVVQPDTLDTLLAAMESAGADAACPMAEDGEGRIGWFPGLLDQIKFDVVRKAETPEEYLEKCGDDVVPFSWSTGVALLVSRRAIDALGFHRADYWVRGEDLEFSLRITHQYKGIFVPAARVQHIPVVEKKLKSLRNEYLKHCAMIQNLFYTGYHLPHGKPVKKTIPGNIARFLKTWSWGEAMPDALLAFWLGAVSKKPAGVAEDFRKRCDG